jgi:hypothetical protein
MNLSANGSPFIYDQPSHNFQLGISYFHVYVFDKTTYAKL